MLLTNLLLAHFWINADTIQATTKLSISLFNDNEIELELSAPPPSH